MAQAVLAREDPRETFLKNLPAKAAPMEVIYPVSWLAGGAVVAVRGACTIVPLLRQKRSSARSVACSTGTVGGQRMSGSAWQQLQPDAWQPSGMQAGASIPGIWAQPSWTRLFRLAHPILCPLSPQTAFREKLVRRRLRHVCADSRRRHTTRLMWWVLALVPQVRKAAESS